MPRKKRNEMTPEQLESLRKHEREYMRNKRNKMTPEQLESIRERQRKYNAENREARRAKTRECRHKRYAKDPEAERSRWRKQNLKPYGITLEEYDTLLASQDGHCAICNRVCEDSGRRLSVDHDHKTGKVRGILCSEHNIMLSENVTIEVLAKMIEYLSKQD